MIIVLRRDGRVRVDHVVAHVLIVARVIAAPVIVALGAEFVAHVVVLEEVLERVAIGRGRVGVVGSGFLDAEA